MTFAAEKEKQASERFMLVRLAPWLDVTASMAVYSGNVYQFPVSVKPHRVFGGSVAAFHTEVFTTPTNLGEYYYDLASGTIRVKSDGPPNTYNFFIEDEIYLSGTTHRYAPRIPTGGGDNVTWSPLLLSYPEVSASFENSTSGFFSFSGSTISAINTGNWAGKYLTKYGSFLNKDLSIWLCINDESTAKLIFQGLIVNVNLSGGAVNFSIIDKTNNLSKAATHAVERRITGVTYNDYYPGAVFAPQDQGKPIHRHFARAPRYFFGTNITQSGAAIKLFDTDQHYTGVCSSFNAEITTSNNRTWIVGNPHIYYESGYRSLLGLQYQSFGSVTAHTAFSSGGSNFHYFRFSSYSNLYEGCNVAWDEGGTRYGTILSVGSLTYLGNPYDIFVVSNTTSASTSSTFYSLYCTILSLTKDNNLTATSGINPINSRDYTLTCDEYGLRVVFVNNFEANFSSFFSGSGLNPATMKLAYTYYLTADLYATSVIQLLLLAAGLTVNTASFSAVNSAVSSVKACFSIPYWGNSVIGSYADYIGDLLLSLGAYLKPNTSGEIEIHLFSSPSSGDNISDSKSWERNLEIEYQDIFDSLESKNEHAIRPNLAVPIAFTTQSQAVSILHGVPGAAAVTNMNRTKSMNHTIETMSGTISRVFSLLKYRRAKYTLNAEQSEIDTELGENKTLTGNYLAGGVTSQNVITVAKTVTTKSINITALDLPID